MSVASIASQQASANAAVTSAGNTALNSLSGNFTTFLNLLMTQLQNQDPTSPVDTDQFTTELVQFSEVEQQINTNSSLNALISLTQSGEVLQGASMVGKSVQISGTQLPVQNGSASLQFTAPVAGAATITVTDSAGNVVTQQVVSAAAGSNNWNWNAANSSGITVPDGGYTVSVAGSDGNGNAESDSFTVNGTVTGVSQTASGTLQLQLGTLGVPFSAVQGVTD
jgi:flagellar basal-body rod modification protein FlgD